MKFHPQHFPVGTVFSLRQESVSCLTTLITPEQAQSNRWVVQRIVMNGVDSFCLCVGTAEFSNGEAYEQSFNAAHVDRLIERGTGALDIDYGYHYTNGKITPRSHVHPPAAGAVYAKGTRGDRRLSFSTYDLIAHELSCWAPRGLLLDYDLAAAKVFAQTWCRKTNLTGCTVLSVDRKRLRCWLKANLNRLLVPKAVALAVQAELNAESYADDLRYQASLEDTDALGDDAILDRAIDDDRADSFVW